jgi:hypothetical protein
MYAMNLASLLLNVIAEEEEKCSYSSQMEKSLFG